MEQPLSRFQERVALLLGAGAMVGLAVGKRRPVWGGITLLGMGAFLLQASIGWLGSQTFRPEQQPEDWRKPAARPFDIVTEDSEESFPASDPPSFAMGVR